MGERSDMKRQKKIGYRPSAVGRLHVAVDFEIPEAGAADEQVVDSRLGQTLFLELGARVALSRRNGGERKRKRNQHEIFISDYYSRQLDDYISKTLN